MLIPIPAIDIIDGKCVRLTKGDYNSKKEYAANPLEIAKEVESLGFPRLHLVDLDGAKSSHVVNLKVLEDISTHTNLKVDFGGGIKNESDLIDVFNAGAEYATIGSLSVKKPQLIIEWSKKYGANKFILGADVNNNYIYVNGWKEQSQTQIFDFLEFYLPKGFQHILCTDISKDGMLGGTSIQLYNSILKKHPTCHLIASGGVSCIEDLDELNSAKVPYVVFGKAIYEGKIKLKEVANLFFN